LDFSKDGSKVAYAISEGGSDWRKVIIMDAITNTIIEDTIVDVKFRCVLETNEGFYYSSYDKPKGSELSAKPTNINCISIKERHKKTIK
jgi:prolyl oligopeptidase